MGSAGVRRGQIIRRAQVEASLGLARTAAVGGLVNSAIVFVTLWSSAASLPMLAWASLVVGLAVIRIFHADRARKRGFDMAAGANERAICLLALGNGLTWGAAMAFGGLLAAPHHFAFLALLAGGMMGASIISYGPLPRAAFAYMIPLAAGSIFGWVVSQPSLQWAGALLIICYATVLSRSILESEKAFVAKVESELALRDSAQTVRLLLNDYESQSADWLWSTDGQGRIVEPTARFAEVSGRPVSELERMALVELFDPTPARERLVDSLRRREAFRDLTVQLSRGGETRWWRLSAQPRDHGRVQGVASDVTNEARAEARVSYMAHYCGLTDLANRFLFNETLARSLKRHGPGEQTAVLCLDLDHFKAVNDTLGHPIGDLLLCEVARRIAAVARKTDMVARLGGDEFAVLLERVSTLSEVEACARRIIEALAEPYILDGMQVVTSTSIGVAMATGGDIDPTDLMKRADLALYSAKTNGRNRFAHFEIGMDEAARDRRELEMDLRSATVRNEFVLHYQPLVSIGTSEVVGYEALIRWRHPRRGLVMPAAFIPLAEETGLIVQIGEWVVREAVAQLARWPATTRISVNLSPAQMRSPNLLPTVVNALAAAGVGADRLELEITETTLMQDSEANIAILHKLRELGVRIALDDFGTGYSSLNYLRSFPFDKIKIDRCFVESIDHNSESRAIVRAITDLADSLGMITTAEGVENIRQLEELRAEGCGEAQGYFFSRPIPASEIAYARAAMDVGAREVAMAFESEAETLPNLRRRAS